jgi:DDE superfamily endonuclease
VTGGYRASWRSPSERAARPGFPPLQRARIVALACLEPVAKGLHITHWSSEDLARQAVADGIVESISPRTVRLILDRVDLQPHRTRYWRTTRLDPLFKARAEKVLWCYGNAERLARKGYWVVCADELPNFQVLERRPIRRSVPGSIEQREFDYTRHGTVNLLTFLVVHTGRMRAVALEQNDAANYVPALEEFRRRHRLLRGVYLIHDGGPSHIAGATAEYFAGCHGWWRPRFTPARASWLDQAELLIHAFSDRYLKRTSWHDREEFIRHVGVSWREYNERYAHPFEWTWTNHKMRRWFARHGD